MRLSRLHQVSLVLAALGSSAAFVACGGGGGGGGGGGAHPDAKEFLDAKVFLDAPPGIKGLGQKCATPGQNATDCPADAPDCISLGLTASTGSTNYCTPECDTNASGKTDGSGGFTAAALTPAPNNNCTTGYSGGGTAMPQCGVILATTPADNPLKANTMYTGIVVGCVLSCGTGNSCPTGLTCDTTTDGGMGLCFPSS